jgi:hypothetical protein
MTVLTVGLYLAAAFLGLWAVVAPINQLTQPQAEATVMLPAKDTRAALDTIATLPDEVVLRATTTTGPVNGNDRLLVKAVATEAVNPCDALGPTDGVSMECNEWLHSCEPAAVAPCIRDTKPPMLLRFLTDLPTAIWAAALAGIAFLFARVIADVAAGRPFDAAQPRRWYLIGGLVIMATLVADVVNSWASQVFTDYYGIAGMAIPAVQLSWVPFGLAGMAFVLAHAFRTGQQLVADTDGLV